MGGSTNEPVFILDATPVEGGPALAETSTVAATWALFLGLALIMVGNGLQGPLLALRAEAEGFDLVVSGLIMAGYFVGFFAGSRYAEYAVTKVGHIRVFAGLASTASSTAIIHAAWVNPFSWVLLRMVFGLCMAGIYVVIESWLNDLATNKTRGRLLAAYMVVTMAGLSGGQMLVGLGSATGFTLFVVASVLVSVSLVPVTLSAASGPPLSVPEPMGLADLVDIVPTGAVTSFMNGLATGALLPLFGAWMFQWPIGTISDKVSRRGVLAVVCLAGSTMSALLALVEPGSGASYVLMFFLGGTLFPMYSLSIAYTNDWLPPGKTMGASATLVRVNAGGAVLGPIIGATLMAVVAPSSLYWLISVSFGAVTTYVMYRIVVADAPPEHRKSRFVAFPARASSSAVGLLTRRRTPQAIELDEQRDTNLNS
ncbi:MAG: MFS transporter [Acidimicrobiales bacterium]